MLDTVKNLMKKVVVPDKYRKVLLEQDEEYHRLRFNASRSLDMHLFDSTNDYLYSDEYKNVVERLKEQQLDCNKASLGVAILILKELENKQDIKLKSFYFDKDKEYYDTLYYLI